MSSEVQQKDLVTTARLTGVWYLLLAIAGMVGFLMLHPQVYVDDPSKTVANLTEHEMLARVRLLLEFVIIVAQALAAVGFYKLFKDINPTASWSLAAWGMMNAGAIMISAIAMGGALSIAQGDHALEDKVMMIKLLDQLAKNSWGVGSLFFGLWLIPMGYIVIRSKRMPLWLGRVLILGGIGYLVSTFLKYGGVNASWGDLLVIPATIGEFWMILYLLIFGIRPAKN